MIISKKFINKIEVLAGENDSIKFKVAPGLGGKILSIYNKNIEKEFLWTNKNLSLEAKKPGADYDTNFWGGIDELIPNDIPETIDFISYPDHGELWTTPLNYNLFDNKISMFGKLKLSKLYYEKVMYLEKGNSPVIYLKYKIKNESNAKKYFLWKFHAALAIEEGDKLVTSAQNARIVYPDSSRYKNTEEFEWPIIENVDASVAPSYNNTNDFFYLYNLEQAEMQMISGKTNHLFGYQYNKEVFPYQWYFASYGGFLNHYTAILEPASSMPVSVNEAKEKGQCTVLECDQEINTIVRIYAGENINRH